MIGDQGDRATVTVDEAAQRLGISRATAWKRVWDGSIPSVKLGGRRLIPTAALDALLEPVRLAVPLADELDRLATSAPPEVAAELRRIAREAAS